MKRQIKPAIALVVSLFGIFSCGEDVDIPDAGFGGESGSWETGYTVIDVGAGELASGECVAGEKDGAYGYVYQCQGTAGGTFTYEFGNIPVLIAIPDTNEELILGDEPYELPQVMACCGDYNDALDFDEQPIYGENCILDAREQACASLVATLGQLSQLASGEEKDALVEMRDWANAHFSECVLSLGDGQYPLSWVGENIFLTNAEWYPDENWTQPGLGDGFEFVWSVVINGVDAPSSPATCTDLTYNNTSLGYVDPDPLSTVTLVGLDEGDGSVLGPVYAGARITGAGDFASFSTSCTTPMCSYAGFSEESTGEWSIDEMVLYVDGTLTLSNGTSSHDIENARIELMGSALGAWSGSPVGYEVQAGDAVLLVAGEANGEHLTLVLSNSTNITVSESAGEWTIDSFEIEYIDGSSNTWTVDIAQTTWLE